MISQARAVAGLAVLLFVISGCADDGDRASRSTGGSADATAPGAATIVIEDFAFSPNPLRVPLEATITVKNNDEVPHTLTADDGSVDTGMIAGGDSAEVSFDRAGGIEYHCEIHPSMTGVIGAENGTGTGTDEPEREQPGSAPVPGY